MAIMNNSAKMQDRERDAHKALTQFSPKEISIDKRSSYINNDESLRTNYWELLMEIPCYCQP